DDNGPDKVHGIGDPDATNGHKQNGVLRGTKGTVYEGGTRVPFLVRWPAKVKPGTSDALMSQMDFLASFAALTGQTVPVGQARHSKTPRDAVMGAKKVGRESLVDQSNAGPPSGSRHGSWKLIAGGGPKAKKASPALYDLTSDVGETRDLTAAHPDKVTAM